MFTIAIQIGLPFVFALHLRSYREDIFAPQSRTPFLSSNAVCVYLPGQFFVTLCITRQSRLNKFRRLQQLAYACLSFTLTLAYTPYGAL